MRHALDVLRQVFGVVHVANPAKAGVFFHIQLVDIKA